MDVGRPKLHDFPPYMTVDERGGYYVRNPFTSKKKRFADEGQAREASGRLRSRFCGFMRTTPFSSIDKAR